MKPLFHPHEVNGRFDDPVVYVDFQFERRALLLDMGSLHRLPPRKLLRVTDAFVSHTHMDHFAGFDHLLRIRLGRPHPLRLYGPSGFIDRVAHKLAAYTWNLVQNYENDFTIIATEVIDRHARRSARFRCKSRFAREDLGAYSTSTDMVIDEPAFHVAAVILDHEIPCLAFALQEHQHLNVWKSRLDELGLPTGPWLRELKAAVRANEPDERTFRVWWKQGGRIYERHYPLGFLREHLIQVTAGQRIAFVVDATYHEANAERIVALARGADVLFIEAPFLHVDADHARRKHHLTARQAGWLAHRAGVKHPVPFHFSSRYQYDAQTLEREVTEAYNDARWAPEPGHDAPPPM